MEQVLHCTPYSVAGLYDRSMMEQSARILIISPSSSPHQRSSAHHAVVISAPYAGDVSLSGGTAESLPDTITCARSWAMRGWACTVSWWSAKALGRSACAGGATLGLGSRMA
jgi:hypothetical protein